MMSTVVAGHHIARLPARLMYDDKFEGRIVPECFDRRAAGLR